MHDPEASNLDGLELDRGISVLLVAVWVWY